MAGPWAAGRGRWGERGGRAARAWVKAGGGGSRGSRDHLLHILLLLPQQGKQGNLFPTLHHTSRPARDWLLHQEPLSSTYQLAMPLALQDPVLLRDLSLILTTLLPLEAQFLTVKGCGRGHLTATMSRLNCQRWSWDRGLLPSVLVLGPWPWHGQGWCKAWMQ